MLRSENCYANCREKTYQRLCLQIWSERGCGSDLFILQRGLFKIFKKLCNMVAGIGSICAQCKRECRSGHARKCAWRVRVCSFSANFNYLTFANISYSIRVKAVIKSGYGRFYYSYAIGRPVCIATCRCYFSFLSFLSSLFSFPFHLPEIVIFHLRESVSG